MKKSLLFYFLFCAGFVNAQWDKQYEDIYHFYNPVFFIDSLNGWIGGYAYEGEKFILKTNDGGTNWERIPIGTIVFSIHFTNNLTGYSAAYDGIYKTTDGGDTWHPNYPDTIHYNSIKFSGENIGWAVGELSNKVYLLKTSNAGLTWSKSFIADGFRPIIEITNDSTGYLVSPNSSKILKTVDGGLSWFAVFDDTNSIYSHWDVSFSNELNGFVSGLELLSTTDGGASWQKIELPYGLTERVISKESEVWVSGSGLFYSAIMYSDDYGITWTPIMVADTILAREVFFYDKNNGWFSSTNQFISAPFYYGVIYKIKNGWTEDIVFPSTPQQIYPLNNASVPQQFNFEWEKIDYNFYNLQLSYDSLFTDLFVVTHFQTGDTLFSGDVLYAYHKPMIGLPANQKFYWRIRGVNKLGASGWSETWSFTTGPLTDMNDENIATNFKLYQNYPNPFNPTTKIKYSIPPAQNPLPGGARGGLVTLKVYDVLGNEAAILVNEEKSPGVYEVEFDGRNLSSGIYFYQLKSGNFIQTNKMVLMK